MDAYMMDAAAEESANDMVASILSLTVQHCPAASSDPKDLCSLLQVSTACRTALRKARGSCTASIKGSADRLTGYAAWLQQHSALVQDLHVDVSTSWWKNPEACDCEDPILTPYSAVGAALAQLSNPSNLSNLKSFRLMGGTPALKQSILGPLQTFSQLTRLDVDSATVSILGALPPSLQDLKLTLLADHFVRLATKVGTPYTCPPLESLTALQALSIRVQYADPSVKHPVLNRVAGLSLSLPPSLTSLSVAGPISQLVYPAGLPHLEVFRAALGESMPPEGLAFHMSRMPCLRDVNIHGHYRTEYDILDTQLTWPQAQGLAAVLAGATDLTSLTLDGFVEWGGMDVGWGSVLQQLTGLKALYLGVGPSDVDVLPLVRLSQLTSLTLSGGHGSGGPGSYSDGPLTTLLEALAGLQELTIMDSSSLRSCAVLFGAVTQLKDLRKLIIHHNGDLVCELEAFVQLTHLTSLTELQLSHTTSETVTEADVAAFRELMPQLVSCRCCTKSSEQVVIRSSWDEMNEEVVVDEMDVEE